MNETVYEILHKLRGGESFEALADDVNRHKLIVNENGGCTAYYFSVPIKNTDNDDNVAVFRDKDGTPFMSGTSCNVRIGKAIVFEGINTQIGVTIPGTDKWCLVGQDVICGNTRISPTLNGVALRRPISRGETFDVIISTEDSSAELRCNSKYFAFMKQHFVPSFVVSPIGVRNGEKVGSLLLSARPGKVAGEYRLTFTSPDTYGEMYAEFNMHEQKLIQDTTVESARPDENNAYGTTAFIGHSEMFGAQQLYLEFNYPMIGDFGREHISSIKLYLPVLGGDMPPLEALHMDNRFCSFGSVWNKRIKPSDKHLPVTYYGGFCCVDLTEVMTDGACKLKFSNGFHLRARKESNGYCALATGDSHLFPPVLEVRGGTTNTNLN